MYIFRDYSPIKTIIRVQQQETHIKVLSGTQAELNRVKNTEHRHQKDLQIKPQTLETNANIIA